MTQLVALSENPNSIPSTLISGGLQLLVTPTQGIQQGVVQQLRMHAALVEVLKSVPSTTRHVTNVSASSSVDLMLSSVLYGYVCGILTYTSKTFINLK